MTVKELIEELQCYDEYAEVKLKLEYDDMNHHAIGSLQKIHSDKDVVYLIDDSM